jgi:1,3-beta-glucan synthase
VIRYAILYFVILIVFIALIAGPIVAGRFLKLNMDIPMDLLQPVGLNNNDTKATPTGTCVLGKCPGPGAGTDDPVETADAARRFARFMAF